MGEEPVGSTFTATVNGQEWSFAGGVLVDVKPSGMPLLSGPAAGPLLAARTAAPVKPAGAIGPWTSINEYRQTLQARAGNNPVLLDADAVWPSSGHADAAWPAGSQQRKPYAVKNRIAIVEISGVLSNDPWYWDETGYGQIQHEVLFASTDADVDGILMKVDSPGGYPDGA
jgi:hypothetical protein